MKTKIIVDTSIWVEYFKNKSNIVEFIEENLLDDCIYMAGPIVSELLLVIYLLICGEMGLLFH